LFYLLIGDLKSWRCFPKWFSSFRPGRSFVGEAKPWIPFEAANWLQHYLKPHMKVFEYGSGGSTVPPARWSFSALPPCPPGKKYYGTHSTEPRYGSHFSSWSKNTLTTLQRCLTRAKTPFSSRIRSEDEFP
jgi:hypothetical protein